MYATLYQSLSIEVGKGSPIPGYLQNRDLNVYFLTCAVLTGRFVPYPIESAYEKPNRYESEGVTIFRSCPLK